MQRKVGGKFHLKLNIGARPIANKYREGKMKRTLKRELKSTWNCWKGIESFPVSIILNIFHWRVATYFCLAVVHSTSSFILFRLVGALCFGVTSESVCKLREMIIEEVVHFGGCYIFLISRRGWDWGAYNVLLSLIGACLISCLECLHCLRYNWVIVLVCNLCRSGLWRNGAIRPVLKHGPRSLTCVQVLGCGNPNA